MLVSGSRVACIQSFVFRSAGSHHRDVNGELVGPLLALEEINQAGSLDDLHREHIAVNVHNEQVFDILRVYDECGGQ